MSSALFTLHPLIRVALTPRQADIAQLLIQGLPNQEIARKLRISPRTVKQHLQNMFRKYLRDTDGRHLRLLLIRLLLCQ